MIVFFDMATPVLCTIKRFQFVFYSPIGRPRYWEFETLGM
jgi:hypothetical protein